MVFLTNVVVPLGWQILVLITLLVFQRPIRDLLSRLRQAGGSALSLSFREQPKDADVNEPLPSSGTDKSPEGYLDHHSDPTLKPAFDAIMEQVEREQYSNITELLADALAGTRRTALSEHLLRHLFGSQIHFLLSLEPNAPASPSDVSRFYRMHRDRAGDQAFPTEHDWYHYLISSGLLAGEPPRLELTDSGRSVLAYFRRNGINPADFPN